MTTFSPILNAPQVASNQNAKEATINTAQAIFEAACNDRIALSLVAGNRTLTTDEFTKYFHQVYSAQTVARTVTIPNTVRFFAASNAGGFNITLHCQGSSGSDLVVAAGARVLVLSDGTNVTAITSGVSHLADLTDTAGTSDASSGQLLSFDSGSSKWVPVDAIGDKSFYVEGAPGASKKVLLHTFNRSTRFVGDFAGSAVSVGTAATAATTFNVYKNGTLVGSIHFAIGATTATFSTDVGAGSVSVSFGSGDVLLIQAPASPDATLADISGTLLGVLL